MKLNWRFQEVGFRDAKRCLSETNWPGRGLFIWRIITTASHTHTVSQHRYMVHTPFLPTSAELLTENCPTSSLYQSSQSHTSLSLCLSPLPFSSPIISVFQTTRPPSFVLSLTVPVSLGDRFQSSMVWIHMRVENVMSFFSLLSLSLSLSCKLLALGDWEMMESSGVCA